MLRYTFKCQYEKMTVTSNTQFNIPYVYDYTMKIGQDFLYL